MRLNDCATLARNAAARPDFAITASVVTKLSIVAMFGSIIPAPLAMPPMRTGLPPMRHSTAISLGKLSLVMMACAARRLWGPSLAGRAAMAASIFGMGNCTPMRPVEQTRTSRSLMPSAFAVARHMARAASSPWGPVQAFALPLFAMMARAPAPRRCAADTSTGAAFTRLVVKVPAATEGTWELISAISSFETFPCLTPQ